MTSYWIAFASGFALALFTVGAVAGFVIFAGDLRDSRTDDTRLPRAALSGPYRRGRS